MQTMIFNPQPSSDSLQSSRAIRPVPQPPLPVIAPPVGKQPSAAVKLDPHAELNAMAELDAMLVREPNLGAMNGLRVALLFNAGLALSGLVAWELWSLLAQ